MYLKLLYSKECQFCSNINVLMFKAVSLLVLLSLTGSSDHSYQAIVVRSDKAKLIISPASQVRANNQEIVKVLHYFFEGNPVVTHGFPAEGASNTEDVSWHDIMAVCCVLLPLLPPPPMPSPHLSGHSLSSPYQVCVVINLFVGWL